MKSTLYATLAIVLAVLAATVTVSNRLDAEGRRTRSAIAKSQTGAGLAPEEVVQRLDALVSQFATLNGRVSRLESAVAAARPSAAPLPERTPPDLSDLSSSVRSVQASLARLDGVPPHLAQLTTFLDQSFEHVERTVRDASATDALSASLAQMSRKMDAIDSYFTPLYSFLGVVSDPNSDEALRSYPSVDERFNSLFLELDALRLDVSRIQADLDRFLAPTRR